MKERRRKRRKGSNKDRHIRKVKHAKKTVFLKGMKKERRNRKEKERTAAEKPLKLKNSLKPKIRESDIKVGISANLKDTQIGPNISSHAFGGKLCLLYQISIFS